MDNTDYEGAELFSVSAYPPHSLFEDMADDVDTTDADELDSWWEYEGKHAIRDWVIDMHSGLCPDDVVAAVDQLLGI
jgi:hypothetical protein